MNDIAIKVENLGKRYLLGHQSGASDRYVALRDVIAKNAKTFLRKTKDMISGVPVVQGDTIEEFWALQNVNFEIKRGDRVGVIGRNGAGKSTLLKILSRIMEPTTGRVTINGRVASLLEVGTGFHPELTGRENIFLNGAILGMPRREIQRKFDEIVDFAEVEKFLDTPVKRYSSGMYTRLAFAVAAHLETEILIVDEVLAVGDAHFQKKCMGAMDRLANDGRTVLFVSHNLTAVAALCRRGLLFSHGTLLLDDDVNLALKQYSSDLTTAKGVLEADSIIQEVVFFDVNDADSTEMPGHKIALELKIANLKFEDLGVDIVVREANSGIPVFFASSAYFSDLKISYGSCIVSLTLGPINLAVGSYVLDVSICEPNKCWIEQHPGLLEFSIDRQLGARRNFELKPSRDLGMFMPPQDWLSK
jgi:lipopolysaccharide transport system ATP-binding protein